MYGYRYSSLWIHQAIVGRNLLRDLEARAKADSGVWEQGCANTIVNGLTSIGLYDDASLLLTPNAYKSGVLYAAKPASNTELVVNGDFVTDTDWTKTNITLNVSSPPTIFTNTGTNGQIRQTLTTVTGKKYKVYYTVYSGSWAFYASNDDTTGGSLGTSGTVTSSGSFTFTADGTDNRILAYNVGAASTTGSIDGISVIDMTGDLTWTRATTATRVNPDLEVEDAFVLGSELITNGEFTTDTDWTKLGGWTISGGTANSAGSSIMFQSAGIQVSTVYEITYTISNYSAGSFRVRINGTSDVNGASRSANGTYTERLTSSSTANGNFSLTDVGTTFVGSIDNVSVKEVITDDVPRIDYPLDGGCPYLLSEPARTNLITYSEEFDNAAWTKTNITITPNAVTSPDGTTTADTITDDAINSIHDAVSASTSLTTGVDYVVTVFAKAGTHSLIQLTLGGSSSHAYANFNISTGAVVGSGGTPVSASIEDFGGGWYRCVLVATSLYTGGSGNAVYGMVNSASATRRLGYIGTGTTLNVWGAQLEEGSYPTSYIPTSGSTVTRNADLGTGSGTSAEFNSEAGVFGGTFSALAVNGDSGCISLSDGTTNNRVLILLNPANDRYECSVRVGGVDVFSVLHIPALLTDDINLYIRYKVNDFSLWVNGTEVSTDTSGVSFAANVLTSLQLDNGAGAVGFTGKIKQLATFDYLDDTQMANLTT